MAKAAQAYPIKRDHGHADADAVHNLRHPRNPPVIDLAGGFLLESP
jgi:hypothetical protein